MIELDTEDENSGMPWEVGWAQCSVCKNRVVLITPWPVLRNNCECVNCGEEKMQELMTVGRMEEILKGKDKDMPIYMSSDPEGESFSPLYEVQHGFFDGEGVYDTEDEDVPEGLDEVICLWPMY